MTTKIILIVIMVILSAYFSATETAFSSLNKTRLKTIARSAKGTNDDSNLPEVDPMWKVPVYSRPLTYLDTDMSVAMQKLARIEKLCSELPGLDCGSCGAPSCRALAEDIVRGDAKENDCIIRYEERIARVANEVLPGRGDNDDRF